MLLLPVVACHLLQLCGACCHVTCYVTTFHRQDSVSQAGHHGLVLHWQGSGRSPPGCAQEGEDAAAGVAACCRRSSSSNTHGSNSIYGSSAHGSISINGSSTDGSITIDGSSTDGSSRPADNQITAAAAAAARLLVTAAAAAAAQMVPLAAGVT
jgi:hypothetical protein